MRPTRLPALALLILACLVLVACREPVPADYAQYTGHWRGDGVLLVLMPNGHADYERVSEGRRTRIEGPAHSFDDRGFSIGLGVLSARFEVQQAPHFSQGRWRMTVDGRELVREDVPSLRGNRDAYSI